MSIHGCQLHIVKRLASSSVSVGLDDLLLWIFKDVLLVGVPADLAAIVIAPRVNFLGLPTERGYVVLSNSDLLKF